jgi:hypothetical protein
MPIRIKCYTIFDITATGIRSQFKESQVPFHTTDGQVVKDISHWTRARNQQRNWETLNQLISLRTLPENITLPEYNAKNKTWSFEFDVLNPDTIFVNDNPLGLLIKDCEGVPMIQGLEETAASGTTLETQSNNPNIWFDIV